MSVPAEALHGPAGSIEAIEQGQCRPRPTMVRATSAPAPRQEGRTIEQPWPGRSLPDVPCTYVLCTEDNVLPPPTQREMAARLGVEPIEIASDHAVFALRPRELAALLVG